MSIIEWLCYSKRNDKKDFFKENLNKANKKYHDKMNDISSPKLLPDGSYMMTACSNLLCTKIGEKPLKKPNIYNNISPRTQPNSPEYMRQNVDIDKIPSLFI